MVPKKQKAGESQPLTPAVVSYVWNSFSRMRRKAVRAEPNPWSLKGTRVPKGSESHSEPEAPHIN